jgi:RNA polymerase sigma factor (sigma-70 family)
MDGAVPLQLSPLLRASDSHLREAAWDELIAQHTRLLLAVARSFGGGTDEAMDRYAYILEKLRAGEFSRLRSFDPTRGASFSTWLAVMARRLCLDHHRIRYGRPRNTHDTNDANALRGLRRQLEGSLSSDLDVAELVDSNSVGPDARTVLEERDTVLRSALARLEPRERLLLALRFQDDLPASRIAAIIGAPTPFHVYRQLNGILCQLRAALESHGVDGVDG